MTRLLIAFLVAVLSVFPCHVAAQETISNTATALWSENGRPLRTTSNTVTFTVQDSAVQLQALRYLPGNQNAIAVKAPFCGGTATSSETLVPKVVLSGSLAPSDSFRIGETLYVRVAAPEANTLPAATDLLEIKITTLSGDEEVMTISETDPNSGEFLAAIGTTAIPPAPKQHDCQLSVRPGDIITIAISEGQPEISARASETVHVLADPYGLVFDSVDGTPIDGVTITLIDDATQQPARVFADDGITAWPSTVVTGESVTDASGRVYPMPPGEVSVRARGVISGVGDGVFRGGACPTPECGVAGGHRAHRYGGVCTLQP